MKILSVSQSLGFFGQQLVLDYETERSRQGFPNSVTN